MKKIILLALTSLMMVGCIKNGKVDRSDFVIVELDSCECICWNNRMAHKGNCRFCEERDSIKWEKRKKGLEELVKKLKDE